jgi:hypothetical protein
MSMISVLQVAMLTTLTTAALGAIVSWIGRTRQSGYVDAIAREIPPAIQPNDVDPASMTRDLIALASHLGKREAVKSLVPVLQMPDPGSQGPRAA